MKPCGVILILPAGPMRDWVELGKRLSLYPIYRLLNVFPLRGSSHKMGFALRVPLGDGPDSEGTLRLAWGARRGVGSAQATGFARDGPGEVAHALQGGGTGKGSARSSCPLPPVA